MAATIHMKNGAWFKVEGFHDNIVTKWNEVLSEGGWPLQSYDRLDAGIPAPKITIDLREISHVEQSRR